MQKTLKQEAEAYESGTTKNIVELKQVSTDLEVFEETYNTKDGDQFTIKFIVVEGEKYRVPNSVLKSLKALLRDNPGMKKFKVVKMGTGMDTNYTVVPLM